MSINIDNIQKILKQGKTLSQLMAAIAPPVDAPPVNESINSVAKAKVAITDSPHWLDQLHAAHLMVDSKAEEIRVGLFQWDEVNASKQTSQCRLNLWDSWAGTLVCKIIGDRWRERCRFTVEGLTASQEKFGRMIRDAAAERNAAAELMQSLIHQHQSDIQKGYFTIQQEDSGAALTAKLAQEVTVGLLESHGVPPTLTRALLILPESEQVKAMDKAVQQAEETLAKVLAQLPQPSANVLPHHETSYEDMEFHSLGGEILPEGIPLSTLGIDPNSFADEGNQATLERSIPPINPIAL